MLGKTQKLREVGPYIDFDLSVLARRQTMSYFDKPGLLNPMGITVSGEMEYILYEVYII